LAYIILQTWRATAHYTEMLAALAKTSASASEPTVFFSTVYCWNFWKPWARLPDQSQDDGGFAAVLSRQCRIPIPGHPGWEHAEFTIRLKMEPQPHHGCLYNVLLQLHDDQFWKF
jgi:hypothetical protein